MGRVLSRERRHLFARLLGVDVALCLGLLEEQLQQFGLEQLTAIESLRRLPALQSGYLFQGEGRLAESILVAGVFPSLAIAHVDGVNQ